MSQGPQGHIETIAPRAPNGQTLIKTTNQSAHQQISINYSQYPPPTHTLHIENILPIKLVWYTQTRTCTYTAIPNLCSNQSQEMCMVFCWMLSNKWRFFCRKLTNELIRWHVWVWLPPPLPRSASGGKDALSASSMIWFTLLECSYLYQWWRMPLVLWSRQPTDSPDPPPPTTGV